MSHHSHISLTSLGDELQPEAEGSATGLATRLAKQGGRFQQIAIRLSRGGSLPDHNNPGEATLLVVEGAVRFNELESGAVHELRTGDLLEVPDERHSVEADEDSLLLLTFVRL